MKAKRLNITVPEDVLDAIMSFKPHVNISAICTDALLEFVEKRGSGLVVTASETISVPGVGPLRIILKKINRKKET